MAKSNFRILLFSFAAFLAAVFPCFAKYGGGAGTAAQPYLVYTAEDMNEIGHNPSDWGKHFALMADIDLGGFTGSQFNLIGSNSSEAFKGVFDGRGHTISNFTYEADAIVAGLFRYLDEDAVIKNLGLYEPNVLAVRLAGTLVGIISDDVAPKPATGRIENCWVTGGSVYTVFQEAGGLAADVSGGVVVNCYVSGTVLDTFSVAGGLAALNNGGQIVNCFAANSVFGVGSNIGAFLGQDSNGIYSGCFYDEQINPTLTGTGSGIDPDGLTGESTSALMQGSTFLNAGWDIVTFANQPLRNVWRLCEDGIDYPHLAAEYLSADFACPDGIDISDLAVFSSEWVADELEAPVDFDLDRRVNFRDWAIFAAAWRSSEGQDNYNAAVDVYPTGGDGVVDEMDAAVFMDAWLQEGLVYLNADIAPYGGDGVVDFADFAAFASQWLQGN